MASATGARTRTAVALIVLSACATLPAASHGAESWLQPEPLSQPGTYNATARIATNSPGVAAVVWTEFANDRTPRYRVRVSTREPDGAWVPSEQLSGAGEAGAGAVGVDPQGRITAVWDEAGKVMWSDKAAGPGVDAGAGDPGRGRREAGPVRRLRRHRDRGLAEGHDRRHLRHQDRAPPARRLMVGRSRRSRRPGRIAPTSRVTPRATSPCPTRTTPAAAAQRYIYAVDRPNSGPWGTQTPIAGPAITDNISDLVVAPNSGRATVFWQDGSTSAPMAARTRDPGTAWSAGTTARDLRQHPRAPGPAGARPRRRRWHGPRHRGLDRRQAGADGLQERSDRCLDSAGHAGPDRPRRRDDVTRERSDRLQRLRPRVRARGPRSAARTAMRSAAQGAGAAWSAPRRSTECPPMRSHSTWRSTTPAGLRTCGERRRGSTSIRSRSPRMATR